MTMVESAAELLRDTAGLRQSRPRLSSLTGMRFIAALLVFATHVTFYMVLVGGSLGEGMRKIFSLSGPYGVGFFFILSGFVLTWTAKPGDTALGFWRRRLAKVYPNHLVTCMLVAGMMTAGGAAIFPVPWLPNLFLLQS